MLFNGGMDPNLNPDYNDQQMNQDYYQPQPNYVGDAPRNPNGKWNTLAIIGFVFTFFFGLLGGIVCIIALGQIKKTGEKGKVLAIAGIILGFVPLVFIIVIGVVFSLFVWPDVQANLAASTACSMVDNYGSYETLDVEPNEDGYAICEDYVCNVFYNDKEYEFNCLEMAEDYE